jgi:transposase
MRQYAIHPVCRYAARHRFLLRVHLRQVAALAIAITEIDAEVDRDLDPFRQAIRLLRSIPGVGELTAQVIASEIGTDMSRFPTAGHLISWAGLCPLNDESAGKRRFTRLRKGAPGSRPRLCNAPGPPPTRNIAIFRPSSSAYATGADPRKLSAR